MPAIVSSVKTLSVNFISAIGLRLGISKIAFTCACKIKIVSFLNDTLFSFIGELSSVESDLLYPRPKRSGGFSKIYKLRIVPSVAKKHWLLQDSEIYDIGCGYKAVGAQIIGLTVPSRRDSLGQRVTI